MPRPKKKPEETPKKTVKATKSDTATSLGDLKLKAVLDSIAAKHGKGAVIRDGLVDFSDIARLPFDHVDLDEMLGGGLPYGRIIEIYGKPSGGKTSMCLALIALVQAAGGRAAFIDVENALDMGYANKIGVNIDELLLSQPDCAEQALDIADMLIRSDEVNIIVVDSVAALITKAELEGDVGDTHVGRLARLMSQEIPRFVNSVSKAKKCMLIFINQERNRINQGYGPQKGTKGGETLPYFASVRLDISRKETLYKVVKGDKIPTGQISIVKNPKNKVAVPHRKCEIQIDYPCDGQKPGLNRVAPLIERAIDAGIMKKSGGGWFSIDDENVAQGEAKLHLYMSDHPEILAKLKERIASE